MSGIPWQVCIGTSGVYIFCQQQEQWDWTHIQKAGHYIKLCCMVNPLEGRDAIPRGTLTGLRVGSMQTSWNSTGQVQVLYLGLGNPSTNTGGAEIERSPEEKHWGVLADKKLNMSCNVHLQSRRPTMSWAACKALWAAGRERGFSPSTLLSWDHTWTAASSSGAPKIRTTWTCWKEYRAGTQRWS